MARHDTHTVSRQQLEDSITGVVKARVGRAIFLLSAHSKPGVIVEVEGSQYALNFDGSNRFFVDSGLGGFAAYATVNVNSDNIVLDFYDYQDHQYKSEAPKNNTTDKRVLLCQ